MTPSEKEAFHHDGVVHLQQVFDLHWIELQHEGIAEEWRPRTPASATAVTGRRKNVR